VELILISVVFLSLSGLVHAWSVDSLSFSLSSLLFLFKLYKSLICGQGDDAGPLAAITQQPPHSDGTVLPHARMHVAQGYQGVKAPYLCAHRDITMFPSPFLLIPPLFFPIHVYSHTFQLRTL
jgi:hypothetical protein